jgi:thioredoxin 1
MMKVENKRKVNMMDWKILPLGILGTVLIAALFLSTPMTAAQADDPTPTPSPTPELATFIDSDDLEVSEIDDEELEELVERNPLLTDKVTMIYFMAEWCVFCEEQSPVIEAMAEDMDDVFELRMLDIDERDNRNFVRIYDVQAIPHVVILDRDGEVVESYVGVTSEATLVRTIRQAALALSELTDAADAAIELPAFMN